MKKSNNKVSKSKIKRARKNKKRLADKVQLSKFERQQISIYEKIRGMTYANILQNKKDLLIKDEGEVGSEPRNP
jgi:hypothetical protein